MKKKEPVVVKSTNKSTFSLLTDRMETKKWFICSQLQRWVTRGIIKSVFVKGEAVTWGGCRSSTDGRATKVWRGFYTNKTLSIGCTLFNKEETKKIRKWALGK